MPPSWTLQLTVAVGHRPAPGSLWRPQLNANTFARLMLPSLEVLRNAITAGYATRAIWQHVGLQLVNAIEPVPAYAAELYLATSADAALAVLGSAPTEGDEPQMRERPLLDVGFWGMSLRDELVTPEEFLTAVGGILDRHNSDSPSCEDVYALLNSIEAGTPSAATREPALALIRRHVRAAQDAWRTIVPQSAGELLDGVNNRSSFNRFVEALALECAWASELEERNPTRFVDGALGWKNGSIPEFLLAALAGNGPVDDEPSWAQLAQLLYCGKVYE